MSILIALTDMVTWFIEEFGLLGIFLTMAAESCLIPIPSEIVMPFSGYVAWLNGSWRFLIEATTASTIGNAVGSIILYQIGARVGRPFITRYGRYLLIDEREFEYAETLFRRYGAYAVFFGRMMPAIRTIISFPAGLFRLEIPKFIVLTTIGSIPWNFMLTYLGFKLGPYWRIVLDYSAYIDPIILAAAVALIIYMLIRFRRRRGSAEHNPRV